MNFKAITYSSVGLMILLSVNKVQAEKISQANLEQIQRTREMGSQL